LDVFLTLHLYIYIYIERERERERETAGKVVPVFFLSEHHAMKAYWGSGGIAALIVSPRHYVEMSGQLHATTALHPGEEPQVPIGWEAGWAPEPFWTRW
jgi:hypothetical protein